MPTVTLSGNLNYTPPGSESSVNLPLAVGATYAAQSSGTIDVPSGSATGATFSVSFGAVANASQVVIKNRGGTAINLYLNGASSPIRLSNNGVFASASDRAPAANPLSTITCAVVTTQTALGQIDYLIFGD